MKTFACLLTLLLITTTASALTAEEKRIREKYGTKYNAKAVIHQTNICVDQYMLLSDNPDVTRLQPWCEQKVIDGWKPFSKAEMERRVNAKKSTQTIIIEK
ncbi:hypothetical protein [Desulfogranum marinum]|jgi:hypothetical protein|uniref:hypothetical protein n=1 Tax=Desulfogranum marinum TaxID=453220 RepID=UPI001965919A|nr:hypothetical protein [Desulfogranum marinum]MBM9514377.1 hypothetical protein [Desulfogranum marinum]